MTRKATTREEAWGLEIGGSCLRLLHVRRTGSAYTADGFRTVRLEGQAGSVPNRPEAIRRLGPAPQDGSALAVCLNDDLVMHRVLVVPPAEGEVLEKLVATQAEAMLPACAERFTWAWDRYPDPFRTGMQRVVLWAARKDALEPLLRDLGAPEVAIPSAVALAKAWPILWPGTCDRLVLLDVGATSTAMVFLHGGQALGCGVVDQGGDLWTEMIACDVGVDVAQAESLKIACAAEGPAATAKLEQDRKSVV
jgi:Tfp pilus assembly PilM family ATPase